MNLIIIHPEDFIAEEMVMLKGHRAEHALSILGATKGDTVKVGKLNGQVGSGSVLAISADSVTLHVKCDTAPPAPLPTTLICAMQRPKTLRKILQCATSMGVKKFIIIECWKVEKSYWSSPLLSEENLREQLILGLEQGKDTVLPSISLKRRFKPFVEDELPAIAANKRALVAHPGTDTPCPRGIEGDTVLALGPEGGFTDYEVNKFVEAGFSPVNLGERIIRTEFAVAAILGRLF